MSGYPDRRRVGENPRWTRVRGFRPAEMRRRREAAGWTRTELARRAELSTTTINAYEDKGATPHEDTLARLAFALGCLPSQLAEVPAVPDMRGSARLEAIRVRYATAPPEGWVSDIGWLLAHVHFLHRLTALPWAEAEPAVATGEVAA